MIEPLCFGDEGLQTFGPYTSLSTRSPYIHGKNLVLKVVHSSFGQNKNIRRIFIGSDQENPDPIAFFIHPFLEDFGEAYSAVVPYLRIAGIDLQPHTSSLLYPRWAVNVRSPNVIVQMSALVGLYIPGSCECFVYPTKRQETQELAEHIALVAAD